MKKTLNFKSKSEEAPTFGATSQQCVIQHYISIYKYPIFNIGLTGSPSGDSWNLAIAEKSAVAVSDNWQQQLRGKKMLI